MSGYNFTDRLRRVLQIAREEAARLHHEYVGTEHLLLALIREREGVAAAVLTNLGAEPGEIRRTINETVKKGKAAAGAGPGLPYTSRAKKVLELAMMTARDLEHSHVGTEHLLFGLLCEEKGIGAQVLVHSGVTLDRATAAYGIVVSTEETSRTRDVSGRTGRVPVVSATAVRAPTRSGRPRVRLALIIAVAALVVAALAVALVVR